MHGLIDLTDRNIGGVTEISISKRNVPEISHNAVPGWNIWPVIRDADNSNQRHTSDQTPLQRRAFLQEQPAHSSLLVQNGLADPAAP